MNQDEKRKVENRLMVMGFSGLADPNLVPLMASLCNAHKGYESPHDFFLGMINECDQEKRREMYDALKPHLTFEPWPLDDYILKLKERANAIDSRENPVKAAKKWRKKARRIEIGKRRFREVARSQANGAVVELTCSKCKRFQRFYGPTPVSAAIEARKAGWVRDLALDKEICPKCPAVRDAKVGTA